MVGSRNILSRKIWRKGKLESNRNCKCLGLGGQLSPRTSSVEHGRSRLEVREEKRGPERNGQPLQSKSVSFDLTPGYSPGDPGYETDDSESTISTDSHHSHNDDDDHHHHRHHHTHHHGQHHSSLPRPPSTSKHGTTAGGGSSSHGYSNNRHPENHHFHGDRGSVSDSDSTIDLPDRFDSQGRLLPQRGDDPLAGHFDDLLRGISHVLF